MFSSFVESTPISSILPDKGEVIVETVEGGGHEVEAEHLLVLEDALAQGGRRLVLHVDGAAEHELEGLGDEDDGDRVVRILAPSIPAGCHKHTLSSHKLGFQYSATKWLDLCDEHAHVEEEYDEAAIGGEVFGDHLVEVHSAAERIPQWAVECE